MSAARYHITMSETSKKRIGKYRRHWSEELAVVLLLVGGAATCLALVRSGHLDKNPWGYIAVAVALVAAISGLILTIAEAMLENEVDD